MLLSITQYLKIWLIFCYQQMDRSVLKFFYDIVRPLWRYRPSQLHHVSETSTPTKFSLKSETLPLNYTNTLSENLNVNLQLYRQLTSTHLISCAAHIFSLLIWKQNFMNESYYFTRSRIWNTCDDDSYGYEQFVVLRLFLRYTTCMMQTVFMA
jgi:hypothetical protein